jgi:hypothetical protein
MRAVPACDLHLLVDGFLQGEDEDSGMECSGDGCGTNCGAHRDSPMVVADAGGIDQRCVKMADVVLFCRCNGIAALMRMGLVVVCGCDVLVSWWVQGV